MSRRSIYVILAFATLLMVTISSVTVMAQLQVSKSFVKGSDWDDWVKGVLALDSNTIVVYGNRYRSLLVAKIDVQQGTALWAKIIGDPNSGDFGDWPEVRDAVYDGSYVYIAGYGNIGGGRQLTAAKIDPSNGNVVWFAYLNVSSTRGLGVTVAGNYVIVVGDTKDFGADNRDAIIVVIDKNTGNLVKVYRFDLGTATDGSEEYFVDVVYKNGKLYFAGMSTAIDSSYDVVVAIATISSDGSITIEKVFDYGKAGEYEIAAYGGTKNSGSAIQVDDGGYVWLLIEYHDSNGKKSIIVARFSSDLSNIVFSKHIWFASDPDHELCPNGIVVVPLSASAYVVGNGWAEDYGWKEYSWIIRVDGNGSVAEKYAIHKSNWSTKYGAHGIDVYGDVNNFVLFVDGDTEDTQSDLVLEDLEQAVNRNISVDDWQATLSDATSSSSLIDVTSDASSTYTTQPPAISDIDYNAPANNDNTYVAVLTELTPPPPIPEMNYVTLMVVVAVIVLATAIYMISRKL